METTNPDELSRDLSPNQNSSVAKSGQAARSDSPHPAVAPIVSIENLVDTGALPAPKWRKPEQNCEWPELDDSEFLELLTPEERAKLYGPPATNPVSDPSPKTSGIESPGSDSTTIRPSPQLSPASAPLPQSIAEQLQAKETRKIRGARYSSAETYAPREWVLEGLAALRMMVGIVGPEKSQKSVLALRLTMHIACGKDFFGFRVPKPRRVVYLDAENPSEEIDLRYKAMLRPFSPQEQPLIEKNLVIVKGRELINRGQSIEVDNPFFWKAFVTEYPGEVYVLDALQMFHSANLISNTAIKDVLLKLRAYCGPDNCLIIVHHTRKKEDREITRRNPVRLREIGVRIWSDRCLGAGVFKRLVDVIVCVEMAEERNSNGEVVDATIDVAAFGRVIDDSPLLRFRSDDEFWHELVRELSPSVSASLDKLKAARGPWPSKNAAAKVLDLSRAQGNRHVNELVRKSYLRVDEEGQVRLA